MQTNKDTVHERHFNFSMNESDTDNSIYLRCVVAGADKLKTLAHETKAIHMARDSSKSMRLLCCNFDETVPSKKAGKTVPVSLLSTETLKSNDSRDT